MAGTIAALGRGGNDIHRAISATPARARPDDDNRAMPLQEVSAAPPAASGESGQFISFPDSPFQLYQPYPPAGDQPAAIAQLVEGIRDGLSYQTLLGVTG